MQDYSGYGQPPIGGGGFGGPMPPPRPPRRRIGLLSYLGVALAAGALGAGTVVALYHPASSSPSASAQPSSSAVAPAAPAPAQSTPAPLPSYGGSGMTASEAAILKKVEPGLVIINTTLTYNSELAAGTGMVISADGLVLPNNHVIENSTKITATIVSTGRTYPAKVVGYDVTGDVAEIKLTGASGLHVVPIGNSAKVKSGDQVLAMGNANGQSQIVPAAGQVTGVNQTITASDEGGTVTSETLHGMIETNADIISGDSGGPLADAAGDVIGMDTAGGGGGFNEQQSSSGYAIPVNTALAIAHQITAGDASSTIVIGYPPFIGVYIGEGSSANPQTQAEEQQPSNGGVGNFGNGSGSSGNAGCYTSDATLTVPGTIAPVSSGTLVLGTICDSPAAAAGLTAGSVITAVNGQPVGAPKSLTSIMSKFQPGTDVSLSWVTPSGQHKTGELDLTAGPPL